MARNFLRGTNEPMLYTSTSRSSANQRGGTHDLITISFTAASGTTTFALTMEDAERIMAFCHV
jgi:phosphatidylethanolamine-binding protein (PEBP) family uncharacterized protein